MHSVLCRVYLMSVFSTAAARRLRPDLTEYAIQLTPHAPISCAYCWRCFPCRTRVPLPDLSQHTAHADLHFHAPHLCYCMDMMMLLASKPSLLQATKRTAVQRTYCSGSYCRMLGACRACICRSRSCTLATTPPPASKRASGWFGSKPPCPAGAPCIPIGRMLPCRGL